MKRWILVASLAMNTTYCGQKNNTGLVQGASSQTSSESRGVASVSGQSGSRKNQAAKSSYPSSFVNFMNQKSQRLKLHNTLRQYSNIIPKESFAKMMELSKKVDDLGITMMRVGDQLILKNSKAILKVNFTGPVGDLRTTINGQTYDFADDQVLADYLANMSKELSSESQSGVFQPSHSGFGFLNKCLLFQIPMMASNAEAIATGWFVVGGMGLIALAIAVSASKVSKNLKKAQLTIKHEVGVGSRTNKAIEDLGKAIKDLDPNILSNNDIDINPTVKYPQNPLPDLGIE